MGMKRICACVCALILYARADLLNQCKPPFYINFCAPSSNEEALGFHVLNGQLARRSAICQAISSAEAQPGDYVLSVDLYNYEGNGKTNYGHPGVLFNARDSMNYDFVHFRPHSTSGCYYVGYVANGVAKYSTTGPCANGPPKGKTWFNVKVRVQGPHSASIYLNDHVIKVYQMYFPPLRRGGAMAHNGYNNLVYFKGYTLSSLPAGPLQISHCAAGTGWSWGSSTVFVNAAHGTWPASGFCRVLLPLSLPSKTKAYEFTTRLYNIQNTVARLGVMYNVQDVNNYDFVYFRPHDAILCYQTGFVKNRVWDSSSWKSNSGACNGGVPPLKAWFTIKVKVTGPNSAQVYKDGRLVVTINPHFGVTPRVGLNVCNGYGNKVNADSFKLRATN